MLKVVNALVTITITVLLTSCVTATKTDYLRLGNEYARDGLFREAATVFKKELSKNPDNYHARRNLGVVLVKLGLYKKASFHLEKTIKKLSKNYQNNFYLAEANRATQNYDKAIFHYKVALNIRPSDYSATRALAWSYYKIKYYIEPRKTSVTCAFGAVPAA